MKKSVFIVLLIFLSSLLPLSLFAEAPIVHDISAKPGKNKKISIVWTLPEEPDEEITELLVYRSTKQISSYSQIKELKPIVSLKSNITAYIDTVSDFSDYFYAVIAVTTKPYDLILLSFNSTATGVHLKSVQHHEYLEKEEEEKLYPEGTLREIPLPYIDLTESSILQKSFISEEAIKSAASLIPEEDKLPDLLEPYIFEEDLISPDGGDDYLLFNILKTAFVQRKYKDAIVQLERMTGTNISEETRNRAYFYLGESYYFLGKYQEAVKIFVRVRTNYPSLTKKWLDSALDRI